MLRSFHPDLDSDEPELSAEEARHLVKARRASVGDTIELLNGEGTIARAEILGTSPLLLHIHERTEHPRPVPRITLVQALPKAQKLEFILQKTTELGVYAIAPVETEHCESRIVRGRNKADRHRQILVEAIKQSGNPWLPRLHEPRSLEAFLEEPPEDGNWLLAVQGSLPLPATALRSEHVFVLVGPEGGFSDTEKERLITFGAVPFSLSSWTLRSETAAIAAVARLSQQ